MTLMQAPLPVSPAEYDRLLAMDGIEFAAGQIVEKDMSFEAAEIEMRIGRLLGNGSAAGGARVFASSLAYRCYPDEPTKFRRPDLSVIREERLRGLNMQAGFSPFPADLVVEVISANDIASDVAEKVEEYISNGFPLVWIVEPRTKTVTIYRAGSVSHLHAGDEITGESAMPGFHCKVGEFFANPD